MSDHGAVCFTKMAQTCLCANVPEPSFFKGSDETALLGRSLLGKSISALHGCLKPTDSAVYRLYSDEKICLSSTQVGKRCVRLGKDVSIQQRRFQPNMRDRNIQMNLVIRALYQYLTDTLKGRFSNHMTFVCDKWQEGPFAKIAVVCLLVISTQAVAQPSNLDDFEVLQINNGLDRAKSEVNSAYTATKQHPSADAQYYLAVALERLADLEMKRANRVFPYLYGYREIHFMAFVSDDSDLKKKVERLEKTAVPDSKHELWMFRDSARRHYLTARSIYQDLTALKPNNIKWQRALAVNHTKTDPGHLGVEEMRAHYQPTLTKFLHLVKAEPGNDDIQRELATAYEIIASKVNSNLGTLPTEYHDALATRMKLFRKNETNPLFIRELAATFSYIAEALLPKGEWQRAHDAMTDALGLYQDLANMDPSNKEWQYALATAHMDYADMRIDGNRRGNSEDLDREALAHYEKALNIYLQLIKTNPQSAVLQHDLVQNYKAVGDLYHERGLRDKLLTTYIDARQKMAEFAQRFPNDRGWLFYQISFYFNIGAEYKEIQTRAEPESKEFITAKAAQDEILKKIVEMIDKLVV